MARNVIFQQEEVPFVCHVTGAGKPYLFAWYEEDHTNI